MSVVIGSGRHRRPTIVDKALERPVFTLAVAAASGLCASGLIAFARLVT